MNNKKTFGSISSDNNVFDFSHIFRRTMKDMEISQDLFVQKVREYFKTTMSYLNEMEMANIVTGFLVAEMTIERFQQLMDILGCKMDITIKMPAKPLSEKAEETGVRPPQFLFWDKPIAELNLTVRVENVLKANDIELFGQLVQLTEAQAIRFPNMGRHSLNQLKVAMREHGLDFETDVQGWRPVGANDFLKKPVEALRLSQETTNVLLHVGIYSVEQLCQLDERKLAALPELTVREHSLIVLALREQKLALAPTLDAKGKVEKMASPFDRNIEDVLDVDVATRKALNSVGIEVLGQLVNRTAAEIMKLDGIGQTRFTRLVNDLAFLRLSLDMKLDWKPAWQA